LHRSSASLDTYLFGVQHYDSNKDNCAKTILKQNPKPEYRNPKQTGGQTNPKSEKIQNAKSESSLFGILGFWSFEFVSDLVLSLSLI